MQLLYRHYINTFKVSSLSFKNTKLLLIADDDLVISLYIKRQQQSKAKKQSKYFSETLKVLVNL